MNAIKQLATIAEMHRIAGSPHADGLAHVLLLAGDDEELALAAIRRVDAMFGTVNARAAMKMKLVTEAADLVPCFGLELSAGGMQLAFRLAAPNAEATAFFPAGRATDDFRRAFNRQVSGDTPSFGGMFAVNRGQQVGDQERALLAACQPNGGKMPA